MVVDKLRWISSASVALLLDRGQLERAQLFRRAYDLFVLALQCIDDVNDRLGLDLPHKEYDTIGGLVFGLLGHEPTPGETVRLDGMEFRVERLDGRRIRTVRAIQTHAPPEAYGAEENQEAA